MICTPDQFEQLARADHQHRKRMKTECHWECRYSIRICIAFSNNKWYKCKLIKIETNLKVTSKQSCNHSCFLYRNHMSRNYNLDALLQLQTEADLIDTIILKMNIPSMRKDLTQVYLKFTGNIATVWRGWIVWCFRVRLYCTTAHPK